jgi:hypothetical protein
MSVANINPKTAANYVTDNADAFPEIWEKMVETQADSINPFKELSGDEKSKAVVIRKDDLTKGKGDTIHVRTTGGIYGEGRVGEADRTGYGEKQPTGGFNLSTEFFWNGTSVTRKARHRLGLMGDYAPEARPLLSNWMGWFQTNKMIMTLLYKTATRNYMYGGRKGSRAALRSGDVLGIDEIKSAAHRIKTLGGNAAMVGRKGKNPIWKYIVITPSEACLTLKNSSDYNTALQNCGVRGDENYFFGGGYPDIDGNIIREFMAPDHEGLGPISSALAPKAFLGVAIAAGTGTVNITGGGTATNGSNTTPLWFQWFSKYAYKFDEATTLAAGSGDRYVKIVNSNGTFGFCSYTTNNGNVLPVVAKLAASAVGVNATTVGSVIYGTSAGFTNTALLTTAFESGATIVECNEYGQPLSRSIVLGGWAMVEGYGSPKMDGTSKFRYTEEEQEHGMKMECGIEGVYGVELFKRSDGIIPNVMVIEHAGEFDALALPDVT